MNQVNNDKPREYAINPEENWIEDWEPHWPNPTDPVIRVIEYTAYEELKNKYEGKKFVPAEATAIGAMQALLEIIRKQDEALKFYADNKNWAQRQDGYVSVVTMENKEDIETGWNDNIGYTTKKGGFKARQSREQTALSLKEIGVSL